MNKILLYFPYEVGTGSSGSSLRPRKMIDAFIKYSQTNNFELIVIQGDSKQRRKKIIEFKNDVQINKVLFCYIENSTLPYWLTDKDHLPRNPFLEIDFLKYLKKNNIPTGLFYRDVYWMFKDYSLTGYKRFIMRNIYRLEKLVFEKYITHFFLPSNNMNEYTQFPSEKISSLPPAGNIGIFETETKNSSDILNVIYVGGISERYGLIELLQSIEIIYKKTGNIKLHLVCRTEEREQYKKYINIYVKESWLKIYHAYGEELEDIYKEADIGIIPIKKNKYNDFAVPVKLFEYMSYGLPIVATNCLAQSKVIRENELGVVVKDTAESLAEGIEFFKSEKNRDVYIKKVKKALQESHLWIHRVKSIHEKLIPNGDLYEKK